MLGEPLEVRNGPCIGGMEKGERVGNEEDYDY